MWPLQSPPAPMLFWEKYCNQKNTTKKSTNDDNIDF